jgi:succinylarginine dihydrolase
VIGRAFGNTEHFRVHRPVPPTFGDEGAANHMRLGSGHGAKSVEVFVYGVRGGAYPARQHIEASRAVARHHQLDEERTLFVSQSEEAIAAGAFHNDVVAVANENVLFCHEQAFEDRPSFYAALRRLVPHIEIVEVPASAVSLDDAIRSYLFNAQLVTLPEGGGMGLILPEEARETPAVWRYLEEMASGNGPIRELFVVDVRQSMANGGGPACLRLRVVADPETVDPRFIADDDRLDAISEVIEEHWPDRIAPEDLTEPDLCEQIETAREALLDRLDLTELD